MYQQKYDEGMFIDHVEAKVKHLLDANSQLKIEKDLAQQLLSQANEEIERIKSNAKNEQVCASALQKDFDSRISHQQSKCHKARSQRTILGRFLIGLVFLIAISSFIYAFIEILRLKNSLKIAAKIHEMQCGTNYNAVCSCLMRKMAESKTVFALLSREECYT